MPILVLTARNGEEEDIEEEEDSPRLPGQMESQTSRSVKDTALEGGKHDAAAKTLERVFTDYPELPDPWYGGVHPPRDASGFAFSHASTWVFVSASRTGSLTSAAARRCGTRVPGAP